MPLDEIIGQELLAYEVSVDGSRFRMSFTRLDGTSGVLNLPSACLQSLVMTLPRMMSEVLQASHKDENLRLVYPAERVRMEQAADPAKVILTLATPDGFEVSFSLEEQHLKAIEEGRAASAGASKREATLN